MDEVEESDPTGDESATELNGWLVEAMKQNPLPVASLPPRTTTWFAFDEALDQPTDGHDAPLVCAAVPAASKVTPTIAFGMPPLASP